MRQKTTKKNKTTTLNATEHTQSKSVLSPTVTLVLINMHSIAAEIFFSFVKTHSEKPSTCKCSRDVVLDLNVHEQSRQSERHVALTAQADVMETCRA